MSKSVFYHSRGEWRIIYLNFRTIPEAQEFLKELKRVVPKVNINMESFYSYKSYYLKSPSLPLPKKLYSNWFMTYNIEYRCDFTMEDRSEDNILSIIRGIAFNHYYHLLFVRFYLMGEGSKYGIDCINPFDGSVKKYE